MRFKIMAQLAAAILCMPLSSFAANGWYSPQNYPGSYPYQPSDANGRVPVQSFGSAPGKGYFRPIRKKLHSPVVTQPRYLPLQVPIADHYVFRPLNPVARPAAYPRVSYQRSVTPQIMPAWRQRHRFNRDPKARQPYPRGRYVYGGYSSARPVWRQDWSGSGLPASGYGQYPVARNDLQRIPGGYRFRPLVGMLAGRQGAGDRFAPMVRRGVSPAPRYRAAHDAPYGQRPVPPSWAMGYPPPMRTVYRPVSPPPKPKRYGTDWYDGRGDGEGAWYQLAGVSWPTVTQQERGAATLSAIGGN